MGLFDTFKGNQYKAELEAAQQQNAYLQSLLTPEMRDVFALQNRRAELDQEIAAQNQTIANMNVAISDLQLKIQKLDKSISEKKSRLVTMDDEILVQDFGLYRPQYDFANALGYKERLQQIRDWQKDMIKKKTAVSGNMNWQVNGSASKGKKMVSDTQKLLLRAFNTECDDIIEKVKYTNFDASMTRIQKSAEAISKLGSMMDIYITRDYLNLKMQELRLAFEYQQKKQQEKEEQKAARLEMKEAARLQKEIEEQRKKLEKEQNQYKTAYSKILQQISVTPDNEDLLKKKEELENSLSDIDKAIKDVDYREANQRAGYVYIISNIGAFGENVYKIGMTRRLDPQERIDELGDASVPFQFDVHAMIFSDDAPALEAALHREFADRKLNMVNQRREFFNVTLDEIKAVVKANYDKTVEFIDVPEAEQYRISMKMRQNIPMNA